MKGLVGVTCDNDGDVTGGSTYEVTGLTGVQSLISFINTDTPQCTIGVCEPTVGEVINLLVIRVTYIETI